MSLRNYLDKLNKYFWFSREELLHFTLAILCLAFIYSWTNWGVQRFDAIIGLKNYLIAIIFIAITVFVHHAGQRMMALSLGFRAEHRIWWYGVLIGLILVALTGGKIKLLAATGFIVYLLPVHRLGAFRYGPNITTIAKIALAGPIANFFFSALVKSFEWAGLLSPAISNRLFVLNIAFAAWNLLPIPPLDGAKVFYYSRLTYVFVFGSITSYVFMVYFLSIYSYIIALLIGCIIWLLYYIFFEKEFAKVK
jgi:Zn-dependent protease